MPDRDLRAIHFHENHFKSGFDEFFSEQSHEALVHYISIGVCKKIPRKPVDEAKEAAFLISQHLSNPVLCLSGGLDSEAMALAFWPQSIIQSVSHTLPILGRTSIAATWSLFRLAALAVSIFPS